MEQIRIKHGTKKNKAWNKKEISMEQKEVNHETTN